MWGRTLQFLPEKSLKEGLLPWVIGVMLFLCSLALTGSVAIGQGLASWSASLSANFSVQIVEKDASTREAQTAAAIRLLNATPGIEAATVMAEADVLELISPWLGNMPIGQDLPIPTLIEVKVTDGAPVDTAALAERLRATAPGAQLDDHQAWMSQILDLATVVQGLLAGVVLMVLLSTVAIVIFGCRAGLATHQDSIEIMHLMGAEDKTISAAFDVRYLSHGLKGGIIGVLFAAGALWLVTDLAEQMGQGLITSAVPEASALLWLSLLPLGAALLTMLTARITVRKALLAMM